ncbi:hypothetical protein ACFOLC_15095 [Lysobacter cavernae]|uniref:Adhesin n=1 Tax=Lysobacter cavernae TaxID=1685901 RepID=A0ABV7RS40_9GAMM
MSARSASARLRAVLCVSGLLLAMPAAAQTAAVGTDHARIRDGAATGLSGRSAVNQAAGVGNAQANLAAIAVAAGSLGLTRLDTTQRTVAGDRRRAAHARIDGQAFAGSSGALSLNQAAGSGNAQLNLFAIGDGHAVTVANAIAGLDDTALAAVTGDTATEGTAAPPAIREARIDSGAFRGSQGVVQVNQTAGVGNASTNAIVLQLPGGAF